MSQAAGRIRFTAPSPQPWNQPDHDVEPGRLCICAAQSTKATFGTGGQGRVELPTFLLFRVATSGTWSLAEVTVATHVLLAALLSRPSPPRQGQAARGRCVSLDTTATARGMAAIKEDGEEQDAVTSVGRPRSRFAGPLAGH